MKKIIFLFLISFLLMFTSVLALPNGFGQVFFGSSPGGADVYVNGNNIGKTSEGLTKAPSVLLPIGTFLDVKFTKEGYNDYIMNAPVEMHEKKYDVALTMNPKEKGTILVASTPPNASVFLDGVYEGVTRKKVEPQLIIHNIPVGVEHTLMVRRWGYADSVTPFTLLNGENRNFYITLKFSDGIIDVSSQPNGADIFLDGVDINKTTPARLEYLSEGPHNIALNLPKYKSWSEDVYISLGQILKVDASLEPIVSERERLLAKLANIQLPEKVERNRPLTWFFTPGVECYTDLGFIAGFILGAIVVGGAWLLYIEGKKKKKH